MQRRRGDAGAHHAAAAFPPRRRRARRSPAMLSVQTRRRRPRSPPHAGNGHRPNGRHCATAGARGAFPQHHLPPESRARALPLRSPLPGPPRRLPARQGSPSPRAVKRERTFPSPAANRGAAPGPRHGRRTCSAGRRRRHSPPSPAVSAGARGGRGLPVSNSKDVSGSGSPLKYERSLPRSRPRGSPQPSTAAAHAPAALSGTAGPPMATASGPPRP